MKPPLFNFKLVAILLGAIIICSSACTKLPINHAKDNLLHGQTAPPDMVFVPGNGKVPSFYVGVSEEANINYVIYLRWLQNVFVDYPEIAWNARIKSKQATDIHRFNDPSLVYHMEHPAFAYYPIVGASWNQIQNYLTWKTDRLNEDLLIKTKLHSPDFNQMNEENFNTESFLYGQFQAAENHSIKVRKNMVRHVEWTDGILHAGYRLPTEAEWELLADENTENTYFGKYPYGKNYPTFRWMRWYEFQATTDDYEHGTVVKDYDDAWKLEGVASAQNNDQYKQGIQGPYLNPSNEKPSNVAGNVREWLLNYYTDEAQTSWQSLQEYFALNGFETDKSKINIYDAYGIIDLKDSVGQLPIRILGSNTDGSPMWVQKPKTKPTRTFIGYDTIQTYVDPKVYLLYNNYNSFYAHHTEAVYSTYINYFKLVQQSNQNRPSGYNPLVLAASYALNQSLNYNQNNYYNQYQSKPTNPYAHLPLDSVHRAAYNWVKQSWDKQYRHHFFYISVPSVQFFFVDAKGIYFEHVAAKYEVIPAKNLNDNRLICGGTWKDPNFNHREGMHPDSARSDVGFRCILPYTSMPVKKQYQVKWD